jgi:hypothetical protein
MGQEMPESHGTVRNFVLDLEISEERADRVVKLEP